MTIEGSGLFGQSVRRREDQRFLTGTGRYVDDIHRPHEGHLFILRSPVAHARMASVDTSAARAAPGVRCVLSAADIGDLGGLPAGQLTNRDGSQSALPPYPLLASDRVRYVGQPLAAVVADTLAAAQDAAELIVVDLEDVPAVTETAKAVEAGAAQIWDEAGGNLCFDWAMGDEPAVEDAFAHAAYTVSLELVNNRLVANAMEPRGAIAEYDPGTGRFTLTTNNQGPHGMRDQMAGVLGVAPSQVRVVTPDVGGGFGMKAFAYPEQALALFAARQTGRPVRWVGARTEAFLGDVMGRDHVTRAELALDADHRFIGLRIDTIANLGAFLSGGAIFIPTTCYAMALPGVYDLPAVHCRVRGVFTNTCPVDAYRGAGRPEAAYVVERLVDVAARDLGVSPLDLRRRNFVRADQMPYRMAMGAVCDSGDFPGTFERGLAAADANGFEARKTAAAAENRLLGLGVAYYVELTGWVDGDSVRIKFEPEGTVTLYVGSTSGGQGHETAYAQLLADRLGVDIDSVRVIEGDTDKIGELSTGFGGSHFLQVSGSATVGAAEKIVEKAKRIAAHMLEASADDIEFAPEGGGRLTVAGTDRAVTFEQVIRLAHNPGGLPADIQPGLDESHYYRLDPAWAYPNGAHIAEVAIDRDTGHLTLTRYTVTDDFGEIMNPMLVQGQVHGGVAQGVGQALLENCVYDPESGQLLTGSFMDYCMPRADDLPMIHFENHVVPCTGNALGVKGCGEAGSIGAPPAVINAICDALGVRAIDMPATAERIWSLIPR